MIWKSDASTLSSPRLEVMTSPVTPTWSPRSTSSFHRSRRSRAAAVEGEHDLQVAGGVPRSVAKMIFPLTRFSTTRPATPTVSPVNVSGCEVGVVRTQRRDVGRPRVAEGVGVTTLGPHPRELLPSDLLLLGVRRVGRRFARHGRQGYRRLPGARHDGLMAEPSYDQRRRSFGSIASDYDRYRPGYPADGIEWVLGGEPVRVLDLAAGTGRLTPQPGCAGPRRGRCRAGRADDRCPA